MQADRFGLTHYLLRRKVLTLLGAKVHIYDTEQNVVMFANMKPYKLRGDIRLYTGEDMVTEVLSIQARQIIDFGATYDVRDPVNDIMVGALRRKGLKSVLRDEWTILDAQDREIGKIVEDSMTLALVRRLLTNIVPQTYHGDIAGRPVFVFKQNFNPFVLKLNLDFSPDDANRLDRRLGLAAAVLLCTVEGRQNAS